MGYWPGTQKIGPASFIIKKQIMDINRIFFVLFLWNIKNTKRHLII